MAAKNCAVKRADFSPGVIILPVEAPAKYFAVKHADYLADAIISPIDIRLLKTVL